MPRIVAMLPTYNEAENIGSLIDAILALGPELEVLVVDDDSPDGTWRLVQERAKGEPRVHLLRRTSRRGRGLAGIAGFCEALRMGADSVIEMDADWSHDPKWIPALIEKSKEGADVVIGSRLTPGGGEAGRSPVRTLITHTANAYIRFMLRLPVRDATSGYRLFRRRCLEALPWDAMKATGPEVVQEVLLAAYARGFALAEVPITFVERRAGKSSFNAKIMLRSLREMIRLRRNPGRLVPQEVIPQPGPLTRPREHLMPLPLPLAGPLAALYQLGRAAHHAWMVAGPVPRRRLPVPVVCVGNLTVGGTGKTPFVRFMADTLRERDYHPAIVSRGYRAQESLSRPLLVSDGQRVLTRGGEGGDEPQLLAEQCPGVPVVVHPDRHAAGLMAITMFESDAIILDDGFQHERLRRDLDLVLWDAGDEPERMRLLPAGRLREGLGALRRASAIILTKAEALPEADREERVTRVIAQLKRHAPAVPVFESETLIDGCERLSGRMRPDPVDRPDTADCDDSVGGAKPAPEWPWSGRRVLAVSGLARPERFEMMIRQAGAQVVRHFAYPDHFAYDSNHVRQWREALKRDEAEMILTTSKDAVKLTALPLFGLPVIAVRIRVGVKDTARWDIFLDEHLGSCKRPDMAGKERS